MAAETPMADGTRGGHAPHGGHAPCGGHATPGGHAAHGGHGGHATHGAFGLSPARRDALTRRVRLLVAATITYNVIEAVVALTAGTLASSTALIGFGLDSVIEVSSAAAVAWQFSAADHVVREAREKTTLRIIAVSFFALAAYVTIDAIRALTGTGEPERSIPGIVLAAFSLAVMPFLSAAQRRAGRELGSASAVADSKQTLLCTYLSAVLLAGLVLNATLGWSWADPVAALAIATIAVKEGRDAWQGKGCCAAPATAIRADRQERDACGCRPGRDCRDCRA
ncbi:cation transporter [Streptomyces malaysiensis]|uniref:Cation efflux protein n=1 Tax=Streptomyces malaysiensis TaxID=92644 RepID=A0A7X5X5B0_STRMQ|nr:cation transporter [Streptomyces malaysiensis]NIY66961.1 cation efflux protein [Streptomyces malaysiensis]